MSANNTMDAAIYTLSREWDPGYVIASYIIAVVGSATALQVMKYRTSLFGLVNLAKLIGGAVALGGVGIWCMHFMGMLALRLYDKNGALITVRYNPGLTALSFFNGVIIVAIGFFIAGNPNKQALWRHIVAGIAGGIGVSVMHYTGMLAMVMQATIEWNAGVIVASVIIGIIAATAALLIFFRYERVWGHNTLLHLGCALVMGVAVCGMHYTGMYAATFKSSNTPVDLSNYTTETNLIIAVLCVAIITCIILLSLLFYRNRRLLLGEDEFSQSIILSVVCQDLKGRILSNAAGHIPYICFEKSYEGSQTFDRNNTDFLRMLKTSLNWKQRAKYLSHLASASQKTNASGLVISTQSVSVTYSIDLYQRFLKAADDLASQLSVSSDDLGMIYWSPVRNMIIMIIGADTLNLANLSSHSLHYIDSNKLNITHLLPPGLDPNDFFEQIQDYYKKVTMPITGERSSEKLSHFLRDVAEDACIPKQAVEREVLEWRRLLGKYVVNQTHLAQLVTHTLHWSQVKLDPMLKVLIEAQFEKMKVEAGAPNIEFMESDLDGISNVYLGLYYVQASGNTGLQVLYLENGPYTMFPVVRFGRYNRFRSSHIKWLTSLTRSRELLNQDLVKSAQKILQQDTANTTAADTAASSNVMNTIVSPSPAPQIPSALTGISLPHHPDSPLSGTQQVERDLAIFKRDFFNGCARLANLLGTSKDLIVANMRVDHLIRLSSDCCILPFVTCNFSTGLPSGYHTSTLSLMPLVVFESLHYSQFLKHNAQANSDRHIQGTWTRKLIQEQLLAYKKNDTLISRDSSHDHYLQQIIAQPESNNNKKNNKDDGSDTEAPTGGGYHSENHSDTEMMMMSPTGVKSQIGNPLRPSHGRFGSITSQPGGNGNGSATSSAPSSPIPAYRPLLAPGAQKSSTSQTQTQAAQTQAAVLAATTAASGFNSEAQIQPLSLRHSPLMVGSHNHVIKELEASIAVDDRSHIHGVESQSQSAALDEDIRRPSHLKRLQQLAAVANSNEAIVEVESKAGEEKSNFQTAREVFNVNVNVNSGVEMPYALLDHDLA